MEKKYIHQLVENVSNKNLIMKILDQGEETIVKVLDIFNMNADSIDAKIEYVYYYVDSNFDEYVFWIISDEFGVLNYEQKKMMLYAFRTVNYDYKFGALLVDGRYSPEGRILLMYKMNELSNLEGFYDVQSIVDYSNRTAIELLYILENLKMNGNRNHEYVRNLLVDTKIDPMGDIEEIGPDSITKKYDIYTISRLINNDSKNRTIKELYEDDEEHNETLNQFLDIINKYESENIDDETIYNLAYNLKNKDTR